MSEKWEEHSVSPTSRVHQPSLCRPAWCSILLFLSHRSAPLILTTVLGRVTPLLPSLCKWEIGDKPTFGLRSRGIWVEAQADCFWSPCPTPTPSRLACAGRLVSAVPQRTVFFTGLTSVMASEATDTRELTLLLIYGCRAHLPSCEGSPAPSPAPSWWVRLRGGGWSETSSSPSRCPCSPALSAACPAMGEQQLGDPQPALRPSCAFGLSGLVQWKGEGILEL